MSKSSSPTNPVPTMTNCAAGVLCKHPEVDLTLSTHHCFHCCQRMHCALWCGASWQTLITTTNITIDSLTPATREMVKHGDHETLNICHACIDRLMQAPSSKQASSPDASSTTVKVPSLPPMSLMSFGSSSVSTSSVSLDESGVVNLLLPSDGTKTKWKLVPPPKNNRSCYWRVFF